MSEDEYKIATIRRELAIMCGKEVPPLPVIGHKTPIIPLERGKEVVLFQVPQPDEIHPQLEREYGSFSKEREY